MNVLMIEVPSREREGSVPFGLLYAASSAYRQGHSVKILDLVKEDLNDNELIRVIGDFSPGVIGMGGITSSYARCKELIGLIKRHFSSIPVVVGGVITSVADLLITKAGADYVIHGEGEISFPNLINALERKENAAHVKGISFSVSGEIQKTEQQEQIRNLDDIPMPEYGLLKMDNYLEPIAPWTSHYFKDSNEDYENILKQLSGKRYMFPIITARGCTHKCIFCYRHHRGLRQHSVEYVLKMIKHLHTNYMVDVFQINDELTTGNKDWVRSFCNGIKKENLQIAVIILSARVDTVDEEILSMLKDIHCLMINYGYESGSDTILKEIKKGVTREQALKAGLLTKKIGIKNVPEIIIGFPSETRETVEETIDFLKRLDVWPISINTPIPFPETYLWNYAVEHNLIENKEDFILGYKRGKFVNFTKFADRELLSLVAKVRYTSHLHWLKHRAEYSAFFKVLFIMVFAVYVRRMIPEHAYESLKKVYNRFFA